jgi:hypothetical protein
MLDNLLCSTVDHWNLLLLSREGTLVLLFRGIMRNEKASV